MVLSLANDQGLLPRKRGGMASGKSAGSLTMEPWDSRGEELLAV